MSVTVLDAGGHLLAFRRDDRAVLIGAIGVGGGAPGQDHDVAATALAVLACHTGPMRGPTPA
ncbi:hypothetical protein J7E97_32410 [Streptomyces sp. ISL-66]|nr:hypothetical protein [Streptomyces sp. ISL-66]